MPHSSGGGSHSGGSHSSGSSHSSSSSSSRSSSGGGYSRPSYIRHYSNEYSHAYVNYSSGTPEYYYYARSRSYYIKQLKIIAIVTVAIMLACNIFTNILNTKHPIKDNTGDCRIIANNETIGDLSEVKPYLDIFKEKTGINVYIVTDNNDWKENYTSCEAYAYDLYVHAFNNNEKNWLIVYTQDKKYDVDTDEMYSDSYNSPFIDWNWEGMQGDETDKILDYTVLDKFNETLHRGLTYADGNPDLVEKAFTDAFTELNEIVMNPREGSSYVLSMLSSMTIMFFALPLSIPCIINIFKYKGIQEIPQTSLDHGRPVEDVCDYCGSVYVIGTVTKCPSCGANLNAHYEDGTRIQ